MARMAQGLSRRRRATPPRILPFPDSGTSGADGATGLASVVSESLRRFPWPANPHQRYGFESPYLAVVNARGPWRTWRHGTANPPFIPLSLDLFAKGFWRAASDGERVFAVTVWAMAAREDDWGIVWGDPVRLVHEWGLDAATLVQRLDWMIGQGLACYLTHAEAAAARSWRVTDARSRGEEGGNTRGGDKGQAESSQDKQAQEQASQDKQEQEPAASQAASSTRALSASQLPGSARNESQEQGRDKQEQASWQGQGQGQVASQASTASTEAQQAARQAGKLPESDQGGRKPGSARRIPQAPPSATSRTDAVRIGHVLSTKQIAWQNPLAVDFARHMVTAITGRRCDDDIATASDPLLMDLGPWVYYWVEHVQNSLNAGLWMAFRERCVKDIARKRRCRGVTNLGGLARAEIVPGVLRAMVGGRD